MEGYGGKGRTLPSFGQQRVATVTLLSPPPPPPPPLSLAIAQPELLWLPCVHGTTFHACVYVHAHTHTRTHTHARAHTHTQPRRVAAMSVAKRVSEEMGVELGQEVNRL